MVGMVIASVAGAALGVIGTRTIGATTTSPVVTVGSLDDFAPASATKVTIDRPYFDELTLTTGGQVAPEIVRRPQAQVFIVRDDVAGVQALIARDTHSGCVLSINPLRFGGPAPSIPELRSDAWFFDPCHGSGYDRTGTPVNGPSSRSLDRFTVVVDNADVLVDVGLPIRGAMRR